MGVLVQLASMVAGLAVKVVLAVVGLVRKLVFGTLRKIFRRGRR